MQTSSENGGTQMPLSCKINVIEIVKAPLYMLNSYLNRKVRKITVDVSNGCRCTYVVNAGLSVQFLIRLSSLRSAFKMST